MGIGCTLLKVSLKKGHSTIVLKQLGLNADLAGEKQTFIGKGIVMVLALGKSSLLEEGHSIMISAFLANQVEVLIWQGLRVVNWLKSHHGSSEKCFDTINVPLIFHGDIIS